VFGERASRVITLRGMSVHTNLEAVAIMSATALLGHSLLEGALIVACFAIGTGLHLACHLAVAAAFGKGIERMVLTRAGRIDYSGPPPGLVEGIARTAAGATMKALCAVIAYALLATLDMSGWPAIGELALRTFARCSLILTVINFLPAVPLDGGLILRSVLERVVGETKAMTVSVIVSAVLMAAMIVVGVVLFQPLLVYLGLVITYDNWRKQMHARSELPAAGRASV
jgi:Zn-dependent protease